MPSSRKVGNQLKKQGQLYKKQHERALGFHGPGLPPGKRQRLATLDTYAEIKKNFRGRMGIPLFFSKLEEILGASLRKRMVYLTPKEKREECRMLARKVMKLDNINKVLRTENYLPEL